MELVKADPSKTTKVEKKLQSSLKEEMMKFLKTKLDAFAWSHKDMLGIDDGVIKHLLNVDPMKNPVQQRRRVFTLERNKVVMEEVKKLLTVGFI